MPKSSAFIILSLFLALVYRPSTAQGHSGIVAIDTLPLHDWAGATEPLSYPKTIGLSVLFPGGGQFYGGHEVRGSFLVGLETLLGGLAIYSDLVDVPHWRNQAKDALDSADAIFSKQGMSPDSAASFGQQRSEQIQFARKRSQLASQQEDLANSQLAWALGLHLYGIVDAVEIAYLSRHRDTEARSVRKAMTYGMLFPGAGQLYNRRYGKFGMLWMTLGASVVSAYSRQEMVSLLNRRLRIARAENDVDGIAQLGKDRTLYRKRRNQYFWGMGLFYVYAVLDGMVDASLSDFDAPQKFAVFAGPQGSLACEWRFPF